MHDLRHECRLGRFAFQFQEFETEKSFDIVQILVGGRTEDKSVNLATLSGKQELSNKLFVSASNFMIIKFSSDASVEKKGFRASWKTEAQKCGGSLQATPQGQVLTSPGYPQNYPGGLECLYIIRAQPGRIMSLEVPKHSRVSHTLCQTPSLFLLLLTWPFQRSDLFKFRI